VTALVPIDGEGDDMTAPGPDHPAWRGLLPAPHPPDPDRGEPVDNAASYAVQTGQRMRAVRVQRGLSLPGVEKASRGRFRAVTLGSYERGDRGMRVEDLADYARWLGVDVRLLLPPEPDREAQMARLTAKVAGRAVRDVADLFSSVSPEKARELVTQALGELGEAS
jgi:transcriptional regulator with XRE-family HTH domain